MRFKVFVRNKVTVTTTWMRTVKEEFYVMWVYVLYRCLSSGAWVREIAVKDHSRVVFLRILTDFRDTSFRMLLNSCANRSCVIATKVIVDQFTGT